MADQSVHQQRVARVNDWIASTRFGQYFQITERGSKFTTELRAGTATFLAMAYILAVNAAIIADSGGPCSVSDCTPANRGDPGCVFYDPGYEQCVQETKRSLVTATATVSLIACFLMGAGANMPLALAPGMGMNAYFAYTVVGFHGDRGTLTYQQALAAIFVEGWVFVFLALSGVRGKVVAMIPKSVMFATTIGLGLFLTHIGMQSAEGIGIVTFDPATLVTLGGCPYADRAKAYIPETQCSLNGGLCPYDPATPLGVYLGPASSNDMCLTNRMRSPTMWLGIFGGGLIAIMFCYKIPAGILIGIVFVTVISWIPTKDNMAAYIGDHSAIPGGNERLRYFRKVATAPDVSKTGAKLDFSAFDQPKLWSVLFVFLYVDFLDTTGTLASLSLQMNRFIPGFVDANGYFPRQMFAFCVDGTAAWIAALLGTSPATTFAESAVGINEGGRTGLTALTTSFWFFICLFFTPIFATIPPYATGPALIMCGVLMMANALKINWLNYAEAIPAFLTFIFMPLTYSIADGVIAGLTSHIFLFQFVWIRKFVMIKRMKRTPKEVGLWPWGDKNTMADDEEFFNGLTFDPAPIAVLGKSDPV